MIVHGYTENGSIRITLDGHEMTVPDDMANRHRQMIAGWEADGNTIPVYEPPPPTPEDVIAERERRLALGFDYDFGDERGVHTFATTREDMQGWDEVDKVASNLRTAGKGSDVILLATNTGIVEVTADEWPYIMIAAGNYRQPIWAASFALASMDPIPADYADPQHWP